MPKPRFVIDTNTLVSITNERFVSLSIQISKMQNARQAANYWCDGWCDGT